MPKISLYNVYFSASSKKIASPPPVNPSLTLHITTFSRQQEKQKPTKPEVNDPKVEELRQKLEQRRAGMLHTKDV